MSRHPASRPALPILTILALLIGLAAILVTPARVLAQTELFAELSGAAEVPGPGDDDGAGFAVIQILPETGQVCAFIEVVGVAEATAAHVHAGAAGEAGDVVVTLPTPNAEGIAEGCVDGLDQAVLQAIVDNPGGHYINVHTGEFPDGAVRGQLSPPPVAVAAELSGAQEVPGPGDPDGGGFADLQITAGAGQLCVFIQVGGIAPATAAHVHEGAAGVSGDIVVTLPTPDVDGFAEGCVEGLDPALLQAIIDTPASYYVNIHNAEYPDGAVRGQLSAPPITVFASLDGAQEVPGPGDPDGRGDAFVNLSPELGRVCAFLQVQDIGQAAAAHIHAGAAGVAGDIVVTLLTPDATGISDGCVDGLDPGLLAQIAATPEAYYVNVHTADYPDGAIRGQLSFEPPPPAPCEDELCPGELPPGTYTYRGFGTDLTFTTVTPWFFDQNPIPSFVLFDMEVAGGLYGIPFTGGVFADPCDLESATTIGDSPQEFMAWLADRDFLDLTAAVPVTYGGASGLQVDLVATTVPAECTDHPFAAVLVLPIYGDFHFENGSTGRIVALDVDGETILFIAEHVALGEVAGGGGGAAAFLARAQGVIDSFVWALGTDGGPGPVEAPTGGGPLPDTSLPAPDRVLWPIGVALLAAGAAVAVRRLRPDDVG